MPEWFEPKRGWTLNEKGYARYTSRKKNAKFKRGKRLHVAVYEELAGAPVPFSSQIHHQDFNKLNCLPENLVCMPGEFNPTGARRCPYTGRYLEPGEWQRLYGKLAYAPDWVTRTEEEECPAA